MKSITGVFKGVEEKTSQNTGKLYWLMQLGEDEKNKFCVFDSNMLKNLEKGKTNVKITTDDDNNIAKTIEVVEAKPDIPEETIEEFKEEIQQKDQEQKEKKTEGIKEEHIVDIKGKKFVTFAGVLNMAHQQGLKELVTVDKGITNEYAWVIKRAEFKDGRMFEAIGSANKENTSQTMGAKYLAEMADTRASGRCLRNALNLDMATKEELNE